MRYLPFILGLSILPSVSGCAAVSVASVLASTTASTAVRAIDEEMQENAAEAPQRQQVAQTNLRVAVEHMRLGNFEAALQRLERAREAEPRNAFIFSVYGLVHQRMDQPQEAEEYFRRSMDLGKDNPEIINNYGQFLCSQSRGDEAEKLFLQAARDPLYRTPEVALTNAGLCAQRGGDHARAAAFYRDALTANPESAAALVALGEIEFDGGNVSAAHALLGRYLKLAPHTPRSLWLGIRIADKRGDKDTQASYTLLLRNKFPESVEAGYLRKPVS